MFVPWSKDPVYIWAPPKHPVRDIVKAFVGVYPPWYVRGYFLSDLSEKDWERFNDWLGPRINPQWLTNYGFTDAVDKQIMDAIDNGNIPPPTDSEYYNKLVANDQPNRNLVRGRKKATRANKSRSPRPPSKVSKGKSRR